MKSTKTCLFVKLKPYYHDAWKSGNLCRNKTFLVVKYHYNNYYFNNTRGYMAEYLHFSQR